MTFVKADVMPNDEAAAKLPGFLRRQLVMPRPDLATAQLSRQLPTTFSLDGRLQTHSRPSHDHEAGDGYGNG